MPSCIQILKIKIIFFLALSISCSPSGDSTLKVRQQVLIIGSGDANNRGLTMYDLEGNLIAPVSDLRDEGGSPRGLISFDDESFLVAADGIDAVYRIFFNGEKQIFHGSNNLSGAIVGLAQGPLGHVYVGESNRIEVFREDGVRLGNLLIPGTVGACTLNGPQNFTTTEDGRLIVATTGNDRILTYNITEDVATCESSVAFGNDPRGTLVHSNGNLYVATSGDDAVSRANLDGSGRTIIYQPGLAELRDPLTLVELPNGDILVSSPTTDSIERITVDGERVGSTPFIRDAFSQNIRDMKIIEVYR